MNNYKLALALLIAMACAADIARSWESSLAGKNKEVTQSQKYFIERYVRAINSKDTDTYVSLVHGRCIQELSRNPEDLDSIRERRFRNTIPSQYRVSVKDISVDDPLPFENMFIYPVRPTHIMMLSYKTTEGKERNIIIQAISDADYYYEVVPFPKR